MNTLNIRIEGTAYDPLTRLRSASTAAVTAGKRLVWRAIAELICYRSLRAAEDELMALDDRMLKDIGLERSEINSLLDGLGRTYQASPLDRLP